MPEATRRISATVTQVQDPRRHGRESRLRCCLNADTKALFAVSVCTCGMVCQGDGDRVTARRNRFGRNSQRTGRRTDIRLYGKRNRISRLRTEEINRRLGIQNIQIFKVIRHISLGNREKARFRRMDLNLQRICGRSVGIIEEAGLGVRGLDRKDAVARCASKVTFHAIRVDIFIIFDRSAVAVQGHIHRFSTTLSSFLTM